VGAGQVAGLIAKPALTGTMRARQTKSRRNHVTKKQWIAYVAVAALTTLLTNRLNELIERRLGED